MSTLVNPTAPAADLSTTPARRSPSLRRVSLYIILIGLLITGYLSYTRLFNTSIVCTGGSNGCDIVNASVWSRFMGIPVAYLGFAMWTLLGTVWLLEPRVKFVGQYGYMIAFGIAVFCFAYHGYLTTMSITRIGATCPWCLAAHTTMSVMLVVTGRRLFLRLNGKSDGTPA
jgi:uncharacterized membrane protein